MPDSFNGTDGTSYLLRDMIFNMVLPVYVFVNSLNGLATESCMALVITNP